MPSNNPISRRTALKKGALTAGSVAGISLVSSPAAAAYEHQMGLEPDSSSPGYFEADINGAGRFAIPGYTGNANGGTIAWSPDGVEQDDGPFDWANTYEWVRWDPHYLTSTPETIEILRYDSNVTAYLDGSEVTADEGDVIYW